jgi:Protein of unknown function (DUF1552)
MRPPVLSRRHLLRGALGATALALPLPFLEAMLPIRRGARASEGSYPDRFGLWFWGNGVKPSSWIPSATGAGYSASAHLSPLSDHLSYVSVVTGCEIKTATHPHHSGMSGVLTGDAYYQVGTTRDTIVSTMSRQTVDQLAADVWYGQAPFRSVEVGVTWFRGTDEGTTFQHLSHNGPNNVNASEYDPVALYRRLFAAPADPQVDLARQSVLDAVMEQTSDLNRRLGASDRLRVEQFTDSLRALETRLASGVGSCGDTTEPDSSYPDVDGYEQIEEKNAVMSELIALALACDLTRVFSVLFATAGSGAVYWQVGATDGHHSNSHNEGDPQPVCDASTAFIMQNLGGLLAALKATPEGDGNLLDHMAMLCTSDLCDGHVHSNTDYPLLICGKGNGRLRGHTHYRSGSSESTSLGVLTALQGAGTGITSFGVGVGETSSVFSDLLA